MDVELTFVDPLLGTIPTNGDIFEKYIGAPDTEESGHLPPEDEEAKEEKPELMVTGFYRDDEGHPALRDYHIKGFFKDAAGSLRRIPGNKTGYYSAYKKVVDGLIFPAPRYIPLLMPDGGEITYCDRPGRSSGPGGDRVFLMRSEQVPVGTSIHFSLTMLDEAMWDWVRGLLDYGHYRGLGQWRNSGMGRFRWQEA